MNEQLLKQLVRQVKIMNFWITLFGVIMVASIITLAFLIFQVVQVIQKTNTQLSNVKTEISQSMDIKAKVCEGDSGLTQFLHSSGACNE